MYTKRYITPTLMYFFTWRLMLFSLFTSVSAVLLYKYAGLAWVAVPWLPVSLIGTAVAFYVGFKNNQAYDRSWEARKVWGGITNLSRSFTIAIKSFVTDENTGSKFSKEVIDKEVETVVYRHLAWLYALKHSMWQRTPWEHQYKVNTRYRKYFSKFFEYSTMDEEVPKYLCNDEYEWLKERKNMPANILDLQSQHLMILKRKGLIDDFRHVELQRFITDLLDEQGKTERIKNTPLPRQFATSSTIFIVIFTTLLPFGMLSEFSAYGDGLIWLLVPFNLIVSSIFFLMEYIGDYSENPFEGLINDVPLIAIVRNIEIDLKDMLGEKDLPERIQPVRNVLL